MNTLTAPLILESYSLRRRLHEAIASGSFGRNVLDDLLPGGIPHLFEKSLWDYKRQLPIHPRGSKVSDEAKKKLDCEFSAIVKDVVSFYNSYGGYVVVGVTDNPRGVEGFAEHIDVAEIIKRALAVTKHEIDCHYAIHKVQIEDRTIPVGLLFVPQRPKGKEPAQFLRDAPQDGNGKSAYHKYDIYFRRGDECRPAQAAADFNFLCSPERYTFSWHSGPASLALTHNLGQRDMGFIKFVGRDTYLQKLWKWLCDPYSPTKLLSGQGGVGKTTLAREFAEDVIRSSPMGLEALIWVSAKKQIYLATEAQRRPLSHVDYNNVQTLLRKLLVELGNPPSFVDSESTTEELIAQMVETLTIMPALLIVDDVDSLDPDQQQEVFQALIQITDRTIGISKVPSRALLTTRLTLGAAPSQLIHVTGLEPEDFFEYVVMTAETLEVPWSVGKTSKLMQKFHRVTDGSPLFASSVLRLVKMGQTLEGALNNWQHHDGEEVRAIAFERELKRLSDSQIRTLYAALLLGDTTFVELQTIVQSGETLLRDNIAELHKYHLLAFASEILNSGTRLVVPNSLQVMQDIIKRSVRDSKKLEHEVERMRRNTPKSSPETPKIARTVVALWSKGNPTEALDTALWGDKQQREDPDMKCLLASAYLKISPPNAMQSDVEFRRAYELGCKRTDLTSLWAQAKMISEDWIGLLEITQLPNRDFPVVDDLVLRAHAYLKLCDLAIKASNRDRAAGYCYFGAKEIAEAFKVGKVPRYSVRLGDMRTQLLENFVGLKDAIHANADEYLYVWEACIDAFHMGLRSSELMQLGMEKLQAWWDAVESRPSFQFAAKDKLRDQLKRAQNILDWFRRQEPSDDSIVTKLESCISDLENRRVEYIS